LEKQRRKLKKAQKKNVKAMGGLSKYKEKDERMKREKNARPKIDGYMVEAEGRGRKG